MDGHCDCMWPNNAYHWDLADVGALIAPRPLLIASADRDPLFTIASVREVHRQLYSGCAQIGKLPCACGACSKRNVRLRRGYCLTRLLWKDARWEVFRGDFPDFSRVNFGGDTWIDAFDHLEETVSVPFFGGLKA